jgi:hypothetical protein
MKKLLSDLSVENIKPSTLSAPTKKEKVKKNTLAKPLFTILVGSLLGAGLSIAGLIQINNFFNEHYFEFRSPVIIQAPILLHNRENKLLVPVPESEVLDYVIIEPTPSPTAAPKTTCLKKYPSMVSKYPVIAEKLKAAFPGEVEQVYELVCRESSFKADNVNKSSGACGLFQASPCSKMECDLSDIDCQIAWGKKYVEGRYKSVSAALLFHDAKKAECLAKDPSNTKCEGWY